MFDQFYKVYENIINLLQISLTISIHYLYLGNEETHWNMEVVLQQEQESGNYPLLFNGRWHKFSNVQCTMNCKHILVRVKYLE